MLYLIEKQGLRPWYIWCFVLQMGEELEIKQLRKETVPRAHPCRTLPSHLCRKGIKFQFFFIFSDNNLITLINNNFSQSRLSAPILICNNPFELDLHVHFHACCCTFRTVPVTIFSWKCRSVKPHTIPSREPRFRPRLRRNTVNEGVTGFQESSVLVIVVLPSWQLLLP
jgi:hypothetical protein